MVDSSAYDPPDDDNEYENDGCYLCGGSGVLDGECTCGEDTCCCLEPTPPECPECRRREREAARAEELRILRELDVAGAIALLTKTGRWRDCGTERDVLIMLHCSRVASPHFTDKERADSACWVEGLL